MTRTPDEAIASCAYQSIHGPAFPKNECKMRTRLAYDVDSDGTQDASGAWLRTKVRSAPDGNLAPRGALLWWVGGSEGHGHVAIADGKGGCWSVDILTEGHWGHISTYERIAKDWPLLHFVGVSLDIDGVQVVPDAEPAKPEAPKVNPNVSKFKNQFNEQRVIDLNLLDQIIKAGNPRTVAAAAKAAKWTCINAVRVFLKVVG